MQSDLFSFTPDQENPYWLPYDTIVRNVPLHGGVKLSDLVKSVDQELRHALPGACKDPEPRKGKRVKKPIKRTFFPQEEFSRLLIGDVLTVRDGVVSRGVGVLSHA